MLKMAATVATNPQIRIRQHNQDRDQVKPCKAIFMTIK